MRLPGSSVQKTTNSVISSTQGTVTSGKPIWQADQMGKAWVEDARGAGHAWNIGKIDAVQRYQAAVVEPRECGVAQGRLVSC